MSNIRIHELFQGHQRFLRSTNIERDFVDPSSLDGYILTKQNEINLQRILSSLNTNATQRAWRITGDYGSGKSSFGLFLAHVFAGSYTKLPTELRKTMDSYVQQSRLCPILITGAREPLNIALLRALHALLIKTSERGRPPIVLRKIQNQLRDKKIEITDDTVLILLKETQEHIITAQKGDGLVIIIDELGKFLEFAATYPDQQDIFFLQSLAEMAARSGKDPLLIIGLLHQGFHAYADQLSLTAQKEWIKVAGRYDELLFNQPLEETVHLVADALKVQDNRLLKQIQDQSCQDMRLALDLGWYGPSLDRNLLIEQAPRLYPLHPTVLPLLVRLFSRFGQNERSLFSFLFSSEPFALHAYADRKLESGQFYKLHNLYDYARATFGYQLGLQSYRNYWKYIDAVVDSFSSGDEISLQILKTIGLLNLLDMPNLIATEDVIVLALSSPISDHAGFVRKTIETLQKEKQILYYRGAAGGYCLWPHTSVNLDSARESAERAVGVPQQVTTLIKEYLETRPLVARRHYIEQGSLRHFEIRYLAVADLDDEINYETDTADGLIIVPLCETTVERQTAMSFAQSQRLVERPNVLVAVPERLNSLTNLLHEVQLWDWIAKNTLELNHDHYASAEVSRQIAASRQSLEKRIQNLIGLQRYSGRTELRWFYQGERAPIANGPQLLAYLSQICNTIYYGAPRILNELVNRRVLSSAAAAARMRLLELMFDSPSKPLLGMDPTKHPPEMSMYLSVLKHSQVHQQTDDENIYTFIEPDEHNDPCNIRPIFDYIRLILMEKPDGRVRISDIFRRLRLRPYGIRDGLIPLLFAIFVLIYEEDIAFYEDDRFIRHMKGFDYHRLIKAPETFEVQYCEMTNLRNDLFTRMSQLLNSEPPQERTVKILSVVRPILTFAAQLPPYTQKTGNLPKTAQAVRKALLSAREPTTLLFYQLSDACGLAPFDADMSVDMEVLDHFISVLRESLDALRAAYPDLLERIKYALEQSFDIADSLHKIRATMARRIDPVVNVINEPRLRSFCLRFLDQQLADTEWLESLGSLVHEKPPSKWLDRDEMIFHQELSHLCAQFKRVEGTFFTMQNQSETGIAFRLAITHLDGREMQQVIHLSRKQEEEIADLTAQIEQILANHKGVGLAAASRAVWNLFVQQERVDND